MRTKNGFINTYKKGYKRGNIDAGMKGDVIYIRDW